SPAMGTALMCNDVYCKLLVKLYRFLINKPSLSLSRLISYAKGKEDKNVVIVDTITVDVRDYKFPKLKVIENNK
ncbi:hypothetical protein H5410_057276, partial [Solanum commersonii]